MTQILNRQAASAPWTIHDSPSVEPAVPAAPITRGEWEVVTRRVNRSACGFAEVLAGCEAFVVGRSIPLGSVDTFTVDSPFVPTTSVDVAGWSATGRLASRRPWFSRVDLEIWPWSVDALELRVVPRSRRVARWDDGSRRRYFAQAHAAADVLVRAFGAASG